MSKVFSKNTEDKEDTVLGVGNDGIRKNGMSVTTAFTDNSGDTDPLIDRLSVNDIDNGTLVAGMGLAVTSRMTDRTCFGFRLKRGHEIKEQRFR